MSDRSSCRWNVPLSGLETDGEKIPIMYTVQTKILKLAPPQSFDTIIMRDNLRCQAAMLDASSKRCSVTFSLDVRPELCSRTGNLHGGAAALVFDMCTGMAVAPLATVEGWRFGGVSRNLNVSYLRPVPVGTVVDVVCEVVSLGKSLGKSFSLAPVSCLERPYIRPRGPGIFVPAVASADVFSCSNNHWQDANDRGQAVGNGAA